MCPYQLSKLSGLCQSDSEKFRVRQQWGGVQDLDEEDLDASFEQYCEDIQGTAAWGGQTELNALAHVLHHHIKVYAAGLPVVDMGQQYQGDYRLCFSSWCMFHIAVMCAKVLSQCRNTV